MDLQVAPAQRQQQCGADGPVEGRDRQLAQVVQ